MSPVLDQVYAQLNDSEKTHRLESEADLDRVVREGLPVSVLKGLRDNWGLTVMELANSLAIPKSTLMRMMEAGKRMGAADSDRVYRLALILVQAEESIGDRAAARVWLRHPNQALGGYTPLKAIETSIGTRQVEQVLGRIAYGGLS